MYCAVLNTSIFYKLLFCVVILAVAILGYLLFLLVVFFLNYLLFNDPYYTYFSKLLTCFFKQDRYK